MLARVVPQVDAVLISANRNAEAYLQYGHPVIDDGRWRDCGPLAGLAAGIEAATTDDLLCVPGDAPSLPTDLVQRLRAAQVRSGAVLAYVHDGAGPQPLCCLLRSSLRDDLRAWLEAGGRTPREWFARHNTATADCADWPRWSWSLNTADEWQHAERELAAARLTR